MQACFVLFHTHGTRLCPQIGAKASTLKDPRSPNQAGKMLRCLLSGRHSRFVLTISLLTNGVVLAIFYLTGRPSGCVSEDGIGTSRSWASMRHATNTSLALSQAIQKVIFVGGVPRSGTTLLRAMLDAHPDVRCGEETRVIPRIISMRSRWNRSQKERNRLVEAGLSEEVLDRATRAFISEIILSHGELAKHLCNKDPLVLNYMDDIMRIFPRAKFVLMVRDGRAVAYSIVSRNITISGVDSKSYLSAALFWNKVVHKMTTYCINNRGKCQMVYYEDLVSDPQQWMKKVLQFLEISWHDNVLHHQQFINSEVSLSRYAYRLPLAFRSIVVGRGVIVRKRIIPIL